MRLRLFLIPVTLALLGSGPPALPVRLADEYMQLQGTWELVAMVTGGRAQPVTPNTWTIRGDRLTLTVPKRQEEMRITLDPTKRPAWISFAQNRMGCYDSIFRVQGDTLQVCMN